MAHNRHGADLVGVFHTAHPQAQHVTIVLPQLPHLSALPDGLEPDAEDALERHDVPHMVPLAAGYTVRELINDDDWERVLHAALRENALTGRFDAAENDRFHRAQIDLRRSLVSTGDAAFFGAFCAGELGIVVLGDQARYQSVGAESSHRRRGLAGHLIGHAAAWAHQRGAQHFIIVTGVTNPAGRLYRSLGFNPVPGSASLYRSPALSQQ